MIQLTLTLKMTTAQVFETSVTVSNNSPIQDYVHPDDQTQPTFSGGFWTPGVTAFFDVRVTHVNSRSNHCKSTATIFKEQENEKKRKYNQRVMDVEMGTFTPLVFGTNGGMGLDCQNFLRTLAIKLSTKNDERYASVISWLRIQLSFAILRSVHKCVRGSRYPFKLREVSEDFTLALAGLQLYS